MNQNKCEQLGIVHAWRNEDRMNGFSLTKREVCANCDLSREQHFSSKEWYSYSDGRPDEPIINIRPV